MAEATKFEIWTRRLLKVAVFNIIFGAALIITALISKPEILNFGLTVFSISVTYVLIYWLVVFIELYWAEFRQNWYIRRRQRLGRKINDLKLKE